MSIKNTIYLFRKCKFSQIANFAPNFEENLFPDSELSMFSCGKKLLGFGWLTIYVISYKLLQKLKSQNLKFAME